MGGLGSVKRARATELRAVATRRAIFNQIEHSLHRDQATQFLIIDPRCHTVAYPTASRFSFGALEADDRCARWAR